MEIKMPLKAVFLVAVAAAMAVGFALPGPNARHAEAAPQVQMLDLKS
jgi:hypothetical protein